LKRSGIAVLDPGGREARNPEARMDPCSRRRCVPERPDGSCPWCRFPRRRRPWCRASRPGRRPFRRPQSVPGSVVSATFFTSLSPVCGFDVFTSPSPHEIWSTRVQAIKIPRLIARVGTWKPGVLQQVDLMQLGLPVQPGSAQRGSDSRTRCSLVLALRIGRRDVGKTWRSPCRSAARGDWRHRDHTGSRRKSPPCRHTRRHWRIGRPCSPRR